MNVYILLEDTNARITFGNRWLVFDTDEGWTVYERKYNAKRTTVILQTKCEEDAVNALIK